VTIPHALSPPAGCTKVFREVASGPGERAWPARSTPVKVGRGRRRVVWKRGAS